MQCTEAELAAGGVKELIVIAQDTTYYGLDLYGRRMLAELLRRLCRIGGIEWIRLHYAYPTAFPDEVIEAMASEPKICKYLDIPFQHISDAQLSAMHPSLWYFAAEVSHLEISFPASAFGEFTKSFPLFSSMNVKSASPGTTASPPPHIPKIAAICGTTPDAIACL